MRLINLRFVHVAALLGLSFVLGSTPAGAQNLLDQCAGDVSVNLVFADDPTSGGWLVDKADSVVECLDAPTCNDGRRNGNEQGVDCGGSCPTACPVGPSCVDGIQNQNETDVDCGGSCGTCGNGKFCNGNGDCASGNCSGGTCEPQDTGGCVMLDEPVKNGTPNAPGTWYGLNRVLIRPGERRVYCAPVQSPLVAAQPSLVEFSLWSERSQSCGSAKLTVVQTTGTMETKTDFPGYYTRIKFSAASGRDPLRYPERAARGTYEVIVDATPNDPTGCNEWEIAWRAVW